MTSDYKYEMQMLAEEAAERDGRDFFALSSQEQCAYFQQASEVWMDRKLDAADLRRDEEATNV